MKRFTGKITALALSSAMIMGMSTMAMAANTTIDDNSKFTNGTAVGDTVASDTTKINLIKDYNRGEASKDNSISPKEDFVLNIKPYGVWNAGYHDVTSGVATAYTTDNMPPLATATTGVTVDTTNTNYNTVTISGAEAGGENKSTELTLSSFASVGDFWYEVEEVDSKTTGVIYGTNSALTTGTSADLTKNNANYGRKYYIHVQVVNNPDTTSETELLRSVTMHTVAPTSASISNVDYNNWVSTNKIYDANTTTGKKDVKVNLVTNDYYAGELVVKKEVTGNAGDKEEYFEVTVTFTKPAGTIVNSDISYTAVAKNENTYTSTNYLIKGQQSTTDTTGKTAINWEKAEGSTEDTAMCTATCKIYVKNGTTVTFSNIPYGITYSVKETKPSDDTYKNEIKFTASKDTKTAFDGGSEVTDTDSAALSDDFTKTATGLISDASDTITITNEKTSKIDIGVMLSNAPFISVLAVAAAATALVARRKKKIEE